MFYVNDIGSTGSRVCPKPESSSFTAFALNQTPVCVVVIRTTVTERNRVKGMGEGGGGRGL